MTPPTPRRFDLAMRIITYPTLTLLSALPLAPLWGHTTWATTGRIAATLVLAWLILGTLAALTWNRNSNRRTRDRTR